MISPDNLANTSIIGNTIPFTLAPTRELKLTEKQTGDLFKSDFSLLNCPYDFF